MTRIARFRAAYVASLVALAAAAYFALHAFGVTFAATLTVAAFLFIPGRVQGFLYRSLFRGQRALASNEPTRALSDFNEFLQLLEDQPWRNWALWLSWSVYTPSAKAMGLNNVGAAYGALGDIDAAETAWRQALAIDPLYSIPHANLAAAAASRGQADIASGFLSKAAQLGYSGGALDRATQRVQQLLAAVESRGPSV